MERVPSKPHWHLRELMFSKAVSQTELADVMGMNRGALGQKLNGYRSFYVDEVWTIMDYLEIEPDKMSYYFPRFGKNEA